MGSFVKILNKEDISLHKNRDTIREVSIHINPLALAQEIPEKFHLIYFVSKLSQSENSGLMADPM